jgi:hypothetical protein
MDRTLDLLTLALVPALLPRAIPALLARADAPQIVAHPGEHADLLGPAALESRGGGGAPPPAARSRRGPRPG